VYEGGRERIKRGKGSQNKLGQRMEKIKIEIPSRKDLIFEGEEIASITDPVSGLMVLWKTKGGKYVLERTVGNDKKVEIYYSAKEASLIIDTYRSAGKNLIKAAQSKDKAFEGLTEEKIE
jgi:hypothetical protein